MVTGSIVLCYWKVSRSMWVEIKTTKKEKTQTNVQHYLVRPKLIQPDHHRCRPHSGAPSQSITDPPTCWGKSGRLKCPLLQTCMYIHSNNLCLQPEWEGWTRLPKHYCKKYQTLEEGPVYLLRWPLLFRHPCHFKPFYHRNRAPADGFNLSFSPRLLFTQINYTGPPFCQFVQAPY